MHDVITGRKYWSPRGQRIDVPYTGSHRKITVYGSLARDGMQFFRTYDRFNASTFLLCLKEMQKHFGKVTVITDRASPHRSRLVRKFLHANRNVRILYFPKGSPHLNAVEECWHQGKRNTARFRILQNILQTCAEQFPHITERLDSIWNC